MSDGSDNSDDNLSEKRTAVILYAVGCTSLLLGLLGYCYWSWKRWRNSKGRGKSGQPSSATFVSSVPDFETQIHIQSDFAPPQYFQVIQELPQKSPDVDTMTDLPPAYETLPVWG